MIEPVKNTRFVSSITIDKVARAKWSNSQQVSITSFLWQHYTAAPWFYYHKIIVVPVMINHYQYNNFYNNDYVIDFY